MTNQSPEGKMAIEIADRIGAKAIIAPSDISQALSLKSVEWYGTELNGERMFSEDAMGDNPQEIANWVSMVFGSVSDTRSSELSGGVLDKALKTLEARRNLHLKGTRPWNVSEIAVGRIPSEHERLKNLITGSWYIHNFEHHFYKSNGDTDEYLKGVMVDAEDERFSDWHISALLEFFPGTREGWKTLQMESTNWQTEAFAQGAPKKEFEVESRFDDYYKGVSRQHLSAWWGVPDPDHQLRVAKYLWFNLGYHAEDNRLPPVPPDEPKNPNNPLTNPDYPDPGFIYGGWGANDPYMFIKYPQRYAWNVIGLHENEPNRTALIRVARRFNFATYARKERDARVLDPSQNLVDTALRGDVPRDDKGEPLDYVNSIKVLGRASAAVKAWVPALEEWGEIPKAIDAIDKYFRQKLLPSQAVRNKIIAGQQVRVSELEIKGAVNDRNNIVGELMAQATEIEYDKGPLGKSIDPDAVTPYLGILRSKSNIIPRPEHEKKVRKFSRQAKDRGALGRSFKEIFSIIQSFTTGK